MDDQGYEEGWSRDKRESILRFERFPPLLSDTGVRV